MGSDRAVAPATERLDGQDHEASSASGGGVDLSFAGWAGVAGPAGRVWAVADVWKRHARFSKDGTWDKVLLALQMQADAAGQMDWNVSVDSTVARVHQHGATAARS